MVTDIKAMLESTVAQWARLGHPALLERFILRNGEVMEGRPLPPTFKRGRAKECYQNSTNAVIGNEALSYYEGFGMSDELPLAMSHAWCVLDGEVVDLTWTKLETRVYMGIKIPTSELMDQLVANGVYGVLDTGYRINSELMFRIDPELEGIVHSVRAARSTAML